MYIKTFTEYFEILENLTVYIQNLESILRLLLKQRKSN